MAINHILPSNVDFSMYLGEWVVVCENKVVAHNRHLNKIEEDIKKCKRVPTIAKIPKKDTLIF